MASDIINNAVEGLVQPQKNNKSRATSSRRVFFHISVIMTWRQNKSHALHHHPTATRPAHQMPHALKKLFETSLSVAGNFKRTKRKRLMTADPPRQGMRRDLGFIIYRQTCMTTTGTARSLIISIGTAFTLKTWSECLGRSAAQNLMECLKTKWKVKENWTWASNGRRQVWCSVMKQNCTISCSFCHLCSSIYNPARQLMTA